jgi:transcription initiation factor TFIIIB Brf1 subunit/transcription initiation factor TFIIB
MILNQEQARAILTALATIEVHAQVQEFTIQIVTDDAIATFTRVQRVMIGYCYEVMLRATSRVPPYPIIDPEDYIDLHAFKHAYELR